MYKQYMTDINSPLDAELPLGEELAPEGEKLQKVLARAGLGSRRELERWIADGRVMVNDRTATLGDRVVDTDVVRVDGRPVKFQAEEHPRRVLAFNKPEGLVCSRRDPEGRATVFDQLPNPGTGRWISIGRLDINTSGLLLFTNDGELANRLMHPSYTVEREYAVRVMGNVTEEHLHNMFTGVELEDGKARFTDIVESGGEGINRWFHVVIMEGRNREVRRLWESQGLQVSRLKRVRYGSLIIPDHLRVGRWTELEDKDINALAELVGLPAQRRATKRAERPGKKPQRYGEKTRSKHGSKVSAANQRRGRR
ncbi:23S rRNA pseudouridine(2605) synthase RluB [Endozoicomonadaceae bacterium StTr2]